MYMNGVRIGMVLIRVLLRRILRVPIVGRAVCTVVVAGPALRGAAVCRSVAASLRITVASASGFAWLSPSNDIFTKKDHLERHRINHHWRSRFYLVKK